MVGMDEWEVGVGYVNVYVVVIVVFEGEEVFGDIVKKNCEFNVFVNVVEGDSFMLFMIYLFVGELFVEEFEVMFDVFMVVVSVLIEMVIVFVLEDLVGNCYGFGIGLFVLGFFVGIVVLGMLGIWKLYSCGIGSISGVLVDLLGVINGVGIFGINDVNICLLVILGYIGIDDVVGYFVKFFIEYVVVNELMDVKESGFVLDVLLICVEFVDMLVFSVNFC